jgi:hypothetical protein
MRKVFETIVGQVGARIRLDESTVRSRTFGFPICFKVRERAFGLHDVTAEVGMGEKQVRHLLRNLVEAGWIITDGNAKRVRTYRIIPEVWHKMFDYESNWD